MLPRPLVVATSNPLKRAVFSRVLQPSELFHVEVQFADAALAGNSPEVQGQPEDITRLKVAMARASLSSEQRQRYALLLVEDTSLTIPALCGMPGPYFKDFAHRIGSVVAPPHAAAPLRATVHSKLCLARGHSELTETFTGEVAGHLVESSEGQQDFGSCFKPAGWPDGSHYDDIDARLHYGCHLARSARKLYLLASVRRAVESEIMRRQQRFTSDGLREFIVQHIRRALPGLVVDEGGDDSAAARPFSEAVQWATVQWLWRNLVKYGIRLSDLGRVKFSVLTAPETMRLATSPLASLQQGSREELDVGEELA